MAGAVLLETILSNKLRQNQLTYEIGVLQSQKMLATFAQGDTRAIMAQEKDEVRRYFKALYAGDEEYKGKYSDYTEIPDFEEEMDKIAAKYQDQLDDLANWETQNIDNQITVKSAELEEIKAYNESFKSMLSTNIQNDYNFGQR